MAVQREIDYVIHYGDPEVTDGVSVFSEEFDKAFYYDGDELGASYAPQKTAFRLWAPTASEARVLLYASWDSPPTRELVMERGERGTWTLAVEGDLVGIFYNYRVLVGDQWNEGVDPYARAVGVNGDRAVVVDLASTNPDRWTEEKPRLELVEDTIIYEVHLRDLSIHPNSGIVHKGKYLGACERGTKGPGGIATGLDHIVDLGVTHVQILPFFDYSTESVDETRLAEPQYNWGYDPKNYNVPEGSYSTDPYEPTARIRELKQLIQALHDRGLRVIMDVVYNHVYDGYRIHFTKLVPGYYLRYKPDGTFSNGSGCGNDTASERKMMRKYMLDSIKYWAREYHVDGFRFDLMGLHDVHTMREIRQALDEIDPSIITIGEGWMLNTELPEERRANQQNAEELPGIGQFNDSLRDAVKGSIFFEHEKGFVQGEAGREQAIRIGVAGGVPYSEELRLFAQEPRQTVNYVECHDNHTLWDKLQLSAPGEMEDVWGSMHRLASSIVLTSQGIPLIHAGQEFMRTKNGVENSYRSPDEINRLDWDRAAERKVDVWFMKELIALRRAHPAFRLRTAEDIRRHLRFEEAPELSVAFTLRDHAGGDPAKHLYVVYNANAKGAEFALPELGPWCPAFGNEHIARLDDGRLSVSGIGMVVLAVAE